VLGVLGGSPKIRKWENVFNGGATTSGRMDKRRPRMDSACRIGLRSHPHESSDCRVDGLYGGQSCRGGIPKIGKVGECFQWRSDTQLSYG